MYNDVYLPPEPEMPGDICGNCDERIEEDLTCGCGLVRECEPAPTGVSCIYTPGSTCNAIGIETGKLLCDDAQCPCLSCYAYSPIPFRPAALANV